jgi:hypothetical protein
MDLGGSKARIPVDPAGLLRALSIARQSVP